MTTIDFLPARYREARIARRNRLWGAAVAIAFGGLVGAAFVGQRLVKYGAQQDLAAADIEYQEAKTAQQMLEQLQGQVRTIGQEAELLTYLRHPWPRTQILRRITGTLPQEVTLERLRMGRENARPAETLTPGVIKPTDNAKPAADNGSPTEKDLKRLHEECDQRRVVVDLSGFTTDLTALHVYLNALANESLFAQAELTSIQTVDKANERRSQFAARLVLAPGHGQRDASTATPAGANDPSSASTSGAKS